MERTLMAGSLPRLHATRVWFARAQQRLGPQGLVGCALLLAALMLGSQVWRSHRSHMLEPVSAAVESALRPTRTPLAPSPPRVLPDPADVPRLLARIERAATAAGLGWPRADYRFHAASGDVPASVEVRCALTGTYPAFRGFVTALLQDTPTLTLREFTLSRSGVDAAEVEAKLAIVVYVAERGGYARP
jgi:hypothetical protein